MLNHSTYLAIVLTAFVWTAQARVITYPAPAEEKLSSEYQVWVDGQKVDVYTARVLDAPFAGKEWNYGGPYSFVNFDLSGKALLKIKSTRPLRQSVVRPEKPVMGIVFDDDYTATILIGGPRKFSFEPDGKKGPLLVFANPIETSRPAPNAKGVIYYGPGMHQVGRVNVADGQTVYLAGGAVVKGALVAQGSNIKILGRGILDGSDYEWRKGPYGVTVGIQGTNILVEGITIRGSSHWTVVPRGSRNVTVRNVKLCNSRVQNDDGVNPCNSQDVLITDCFIRSDDDCVAMKGMDFKAANSNVERVTVENCILWCDRARIFLLGHESRAQYMRKIVLRNLDIIHFTMTPFLFEPGEEMSLEDVLVENVRVYGEGQNEFIRLKPVVNQYMQKKVPGYVKNITFKNVHLTGAPGAYKVQLIGADEQHSVSNIRIQNVTIGGKPLEQNSSHLTIGKHVSGVEFKK